MTRLPYLQYFAREFFQAWYYNYLDDEGQRFYVTYPDLSNETD